MNANWYTVPNLYFIDLILSPQTAKMTKVHYSNPHTQVISLFCGMRLYNYSGENLRERKGEGHTHIQNNIANITL